MLKHILMVIVMAVTLFMGTTGTSQAMIGEPDVVYYGTATSAAGGNSVAITLDGAASPLVSYTVGADLKYVIRVPMDSVGARVAGTARTGDAAVININGALAAKVVIPARGTLVKMDIAKRDAGQWGTDHPGDSGSGDLNRNGISDLTEYLDGKDPASCVWTAVDATHAETTVYHQQVLKNCLADAGADQKHNLVKVTKGSYAGNFSYSAAWGEEYDLTLIGGYDPAGVAERSADAALTILNGDTDNDGTGNGITLVVDTDSGKAHGKIRIESLNVKNGKAPAGQKGGGIQARIYQGDLELAGNIISGNSADNGGGLSVDNSDNAPVFLTNNAIYGNSAANAAAVRIVSASGPVTLLNNSIADNTAGANGDGRSLLIESSVAAVDLTNNIISASAGVSGSDIFINSSGVTIPLTISHNAYDAVNGLLANSPGFVADANAVAAAPQFVNATAGDYRLASVSPCIDKGIVHAKLTEKDAAGAIRISGVVDMGAYEFYKSVATITLGGLSATCDDTAKNVTTVTDPPGKAVVFTYDGNSTEPVNAGSYAVVATINDSDYQGSASGTLVIAKGTATIALGGLSQIYDGTAKSVTATTAPSGKSVTITYNGSAAAPTNAGSYAVVGTINDANYQGTASGSLTIAKVTPVITWNTPAAITAGSALSTSQLNASANVAGTFSYTPAAGTILSAGSPALTVSFTPNDTSNYTGTSASVTLTVNAAPVIADTTAPAVDAFTIPATLTSLTCPVTSFTASDATGVTGYLVSENASQPAADAAWSATAPVEYTFASQGTKTLYAFAKDAAGNVSVPLSASVTITIPDTAAPAVDAFSIPTSLTSLTCPIATLTATDDTAVTAWLLSESATATAGDSRWSATKPADYTFAGQGSKTLYAFAKDAAGNVSAPLSATVAVTLPDTAAPTVTGFTMPGASSSLTVSIDTLTASDDTGVTSYFISESATQPAAYATGWSSNAPTSYTFASQGDKTLYTFAKDAAGNVSLPASAGVTITLPDSTAPVVASFTLPATSASLTVAVTSFTATDDSAVTGYLLSETVTATAASGNWTLTPTSSYTFATGGDKTLYAFARDAAGNISAAVTAAVVITLPDITAPSVSGFSVTGSANSLTVTVSNFTAIDDSAVTGYIVSESATAPAAADSGWTSTPPASYTFATGGSKTLYSYAKDAAGNVSAAATTTVTVSTILRNGNGGSGADPTIADALKALRAYLDLVTLSSDDQIRYDVAPLSTSGVPEGNGVVDFSDAIIILRRSIGIGSW